MNPRSQHIPLLKTISSFYDTFRIGKAQNDFFTIMRMEDQAKGKLLFMPLFRGNFFRLVFCKTPGLRFLLPDQTLDSSVNSLYFAYPGKLESWQRVEVIYGYLCCFTPEFAGIDMMHSSFEDEFPFLTAGAYSIIRLTDDEADTLSKTAEALLTEMNSGHADKFDMIRHLLRMLLIQIRRMYEQRNATKTTAQLNHAAIMGRFRNAVNYHFIAMAASGVSQRPSVSLFADRLNINASYLNAIIKQNSGLTASHFIQGKMLLEAKSYLMHTDLQVAEISYRLLFSDVPYFTRFFKKMTGSTPSSFRLSFLKKFDHDFSKENL
jgi:AraC family transcriptional activator of pobA